VKPKPVHLLSWLTRHLLYTVPLLAFTLSALAFTVALAFLGHYRLATLALLAFATWGPLSALVIYTRSLLKPKRPM
jgi:hypothetical protein